MNVVELNQVVKSFGPGSCAIAYEAKAPNGDPVFLKQYKSPSVTVAWYRPSTEKCSRQCAPHSALWKRFSTKISSLMCCGIEVSQVLYSSLYSLREGVSNLITLPSERCGLRIMRASLPLRAASRKRFEKSFARIAATASKSFSKSATNTWPGRIA